MAIVYQSHLYNYNIEFGTDIPTIFGADFGFCKHGSGPMYHARIHFLSIPKNDKTILDSSKIDKTLLKCVESFTVMVKKKKHHTSS